MKVLLERARRLLATPNKAARVKAWLGAHVRHARQLSPISRMRAWAHGARGRCDSAAEIWRGLAERATEPAAAAVSWTQHGRYRLYSGRLLEAAESLERALALCPDYLPARQLLAACAVERQDWAEASRQWRIVLAAGPPPDELAHILQSLAQSLIEQGAFTDAAAVIERLSALAPDRALQLQAIAADKLFDDDAARAAWESLHRRYPTAAYDSALWLKFVGGTDAPDAARFTPDDLARAADAQTAQRILRYLDGRMPYPAYLALTENTARRFPDSAALRAWHIDILLDSLRGDDDLKAAAVAAHAFVERFPKHAHGRRLLANAAVAAHDMDAVEQIARAAGYADLQVWLAAARGEWAAAKALSRRLRASRYTHAENGHGLDLRPLNAEPRPALNDKILLFTCFRNERDFLPWFLAYYRAIGVDWFFIVDNGSKDDTAQRLTAQKDCTVFASADKFVATASGMRWINELIRRYGRDNWCVYVDADEQFIAPGIESRGLRGLVDDMAAKGEEVMPAYMLDTYPQHMGALRDFKPGDSPLAVSRLLDPDYYFFGSRACCFFKARGGARERLFGVREKVEKAPILRGGCGLYLDNHSVTYARVSARCGALLHHKIMREALEAQKTEHNEWRMAGRRAFRWRIHKRYRDSGLLDVSAELPRGRGVVEYKDSVQLERLGLIGDFAKITGRVARRRPSLSP